MILSLFKFFRNDGNSVRLMVGVGEYANVVRQDGRAFAATYGLDPRWLSNVEPEVVPVSASRALCLTVDPAIQHIAGAYDDGPNPRLWSFRIPSGRWASHPTIGGLSVSGLYALALADGPEQALSVLKASAKDEASFRTVECAPEPMPVKIMPGVLVWAEV